MKIKRPKTARHVFHGIPVSPGVGQGTVYVHDSQKPSIERRAVPPDQVEAEVERFNEAVEKTRKQLKWTQQMVSSKIDKAHGAIFEAQELLLDDPLLVGSCRDEIQRQKLNAEYLLEEIVSKIRTLFSEIEVAQSFTKNLDVLDVAARINENLVPQSSPTLEKFPRDAIIVARDLRPSDTARLNPRHVLGIVTETGGPTSHSAILAKALKIPAVVGLEGIINSVRPGDTLILDGFSGTVTTSPNRQDLERLRQRRLRIEVAQESLDKFRDLPCETLDGYSIDLAANMELPSELPNIIQSGARGIGLFRSEFFYIGRGYIPPEEEQFQVYRDVIEKVAPRPVICRTLDIGGDKFISNSGVETDEMNTFLGLRAIRLCLANPEIFRSQLRAILRASAFGNVKIMFPFITDISEVRKSKDFLEGIKRELTREGLEFDPNIQVGIMIETPSAALTASTLAEEVDFFSIGTNDLIQYTMAIDRVNESVAHLYNPIHPAVIHLIRHTIEAAHKSGIWLGLCGEMASDPALAVLLMGMGIDELSMSPVAIPEIKRLIRSLTLEEVRKLRQDVLANIETEQASKILNRFRRKHMKAHKISA